MHEMSSTWFAFSFELVSPESLRLSFRID